MIALKIIGSGSLYVAAHSRIGQSKASTLTPVCSAVRPVCSGSGVHEPDIVAPPSPRPASAPPAWPPSPPPSGLPPPSPPDPPSLPSLILDPLPPQAHRTRASALTPRAARPTRPLPSSSSIGKLSPI